MSDTYTNLEVIAPSVEEAIAKGLAELGLSEGEVEVEVLDSGNRGLLGIGSRQARIRMTIKGAESGVERDMTPQVVENQAGTQPVDFAKEEMDETEAGEMSTQDEIALHLGREVVLELLERMHVHTRVSAVFEQPDDARSRRPLYVNVEGEDLSILIGPRAETLNALQYIANLIVGKELGRSIPLVVDVESYRKRRAEELRRLARRMAEQAVNTGRRQVLEPMPANERRLVHIELRDHPDVFTESIGEEPRRKVTINLKESN